MSLTEPEQAPPTDPQTLLSRVRAARNLREAGRLDEAETVLGPVLHANERHVGALAELAQILRRRGDREAAAATFGRALAADPANLDVRLEYGRDLRELGRLDEAAATFDTILGAKPDHVGALAELAKVRRSQGDGEAALALLRQAAQTDPSNIGVTAELARQLRLGGQDEAAIAELRRLAVQAPEQGDAHGLLGQALLDLGRLGDAEASLKRALELAPANTWLAAALARLEQRRGPRAAALAVQEPSLAVKQARDLSLSGHPDEAERVLGEVLAAHPRHIGALAELAKSRRRRGDRAGAVALFERAAAADPANLDLWLEYGRDLRDLGRLQDAEAALGHVLLAKPAHAGALAEVAKIRRNQGDRPAAIELFRAAASSAPTDVGVRAELARELRQAGHAEAAVDELTALAALAPDDPVARLLLGQLMMDLHRHEAAQAAFQAALDRDPDCVQACLGLGHLARRRGDRTASRLQFRRAAELRPSDLNVQLELAAELREAGEMEEALAMIQAVLAGDHDHWGGLVQWGLILRAGSEHRRALERFQRAAELQPLQAQAYVEMAREHWALGRPDQAQQALARGREADPNHIGPWIVAAEYALAGEDYDAALGLVRCGLQIDQVNVWAHLVGARAAAGKLDFAAARAFLDEAEAKAGPQPGIAVARSHLHRQDRRFEAAQAVIVEARTAFPSSFEVWHEAMSVALTLGQFNCVEPELEARVASTRAERAIVEGLRAQLALARHDHPAAVASFQAALALNPFSAHWRYDLALCRLLQVQVEETRSQLKAWVELNRAANILRRQSSNISQSHLGQMLDDFVLDAGLVADLRRAMSEPPAGRLSRLAEVMRNNPDATAPALLYLLAAQEAGLVSPAAANGPSSIPRRLCQYWDADPPPDVAAMMESWREAHPTYDYERFDDNSAEAFIRAHHPSAVAAAFRRSTHPAQRADLFRLAWLAVKGGFYVDADDLCLRPLEEFIPAGANFVGYQEDVGTLANNLLGAFPGHPVILNALAMATEAVNRGDGDMVWLQTGPGLLTRAFARATANRPHPLRPGEIAILELWQVNRAAAIHRPALYKLTPRHWSRAAFRTQLTLDKPAIVDVNLASP